MKLTIFSSLIVLSTALISAAPTANLTPRADRGSYIVSGLEVRKKAVISAGGTTLDLTIAVLEIDTMTMNYLYGTQPSL